MATQALASNAGSLDDSHIPTPPSRKRKSDTPSTVTSKKSRTTPTRTAASSSNPAAQALVTAVLANTPAYLDPANPQAMGNAMVTLASYARQLEIALAAGAGAGGSGSAQPPQKSREQLAAAAEKLCKTVVNGIRKQMSWKPSCKTGSARFVYDGICPDPSVFGVLMGLDGPPTWKMKKFSKEDFEELFGEIQASVRRDRNDRYDYLFITSKDVNMLQTSANHVLLQTDDLDELMTSILLIPQSNQSNNPLAIHHTSISMVSGFRLNVCTRQMREIVMAVLKDNTNNYGMNAHEIMKAAKDKFPNEVTSTVGLTMDTHKPLDKAEHPLSSMRHLKKVILEDMAARQQIERINIKNGGFNANGEPVVRVKSSKGAELLPTKKPKTGVEFLWRLLPGGSAFLDIGDNSRPPARKGKLRSEIYISRKPALVQRKDVMKE
ncbi:hypothetical protein EW146_g3382 [Bondarzewia mesenterica]|uniref:Uncharacterized protein n=1 Tax=Bondarzewia mesenterica TaxID=1095465 RepID=A0A4V3XFG3_9AGAM|nr:hypothetical protein EW146_g3382 [Bondarzewia mesenterica]